MSAQAVYLSNIGECSLPLFDRHCERGTLSIVLISPRGLQRLNLQSDCLTSVLSVRSSAYKQRGLTLQQCCGSDKKQFLKEKWSFVLVQTMVFPQISMSAQQALPGPVQNKTPEGFQQSSCALTVSTGRELKSVINRLTVMSGYVARRAVMPPRAPERPSTAALFAAIFWLMKKRPCQPLRWDVVSKIAL